jgi:hypothetical protein
MADDRRIVQAEVRAAMRKAEMMAPLTKEKEKYGKEEMKTAHAKLVELKLLKKELPETASYHILSFLSGKTMAGKVGEKRKEVSGMRGRGGSPPPSKIRRF